MSWSNADVTLTIAIRGKYMSLLLGKMFFQIFKTVSEFAVFVCDFYNNF